MAPDRGLTFIVRTQNEDGAAQRRRISSINAHTALAAHERRRRRKGQDLLPEDQEEPSLTTSSRSQPLSQAGKPSRKQNPRTANPSGRASGDSVASAGPTASAALHSQPDADDADILARASSSSWSDFDVSNHSIDYDVTITLHDDPDDTLAAEYDSHKSDDTKSLHISRKLSLSKFRHQQYNDQYLSSSINSALDPFLHLAEDVTSHEKNLLQFYNTSLVQKLFGTRSDAQQCPGRQLAIPAFQTNKVFIQTIIVVTEHFQSLLRGQPPSKNMFKRRADSYRSLNAIISNPESSRDDILLGMIGIMFTDFMLGRRDLQQLHIEALDIYIRRQGGIGKFISEPAVIVSPWYVAIQYGFIEFPLRTLSDVEASAANFLRSMRNIKHCVNIIRIKFASLAASALAQQNVKDARTMISDNDISSPADYKAFVKAKSEIDVFIKPLFYDPEAIYVEGTFLLSLLLGMGLTLFDLGSNLGHMALFLNRLNYIVQKSLAPREAGEGVSVTTASVAAFVDHVRKEVFTIIDGAESALVKEVGLSSATINALKVFSIMTCELRGHIIRHLRSWVVDTLIPPEESPCSCGVDDGDFSNLSVEIVDAWVGLSPEPQYDPVRVQD